MERFRGSSLAIMADARAKGQGRSCPDESANQKKSARRNSRTFRDRSRNGRKTPFVSGRGGGCPVGVRGGYPEKNNQHGEFGLHRSWQIWYNDGAESCSPVHLNWARPHADGRALPMLRAETIFGAGENGLGRRQPPLANGGNGRDRRRTDSNVRATRTYARTAMAVPPEWSHR